ncbi:hypothetical protein [Nitrospirillum pindoramense]|uniref:hypothetical protein n=1 Tax=Nitrospirillum amazonense TaxID=28077 RepID=UPI0011A50E1A|nr:hypothetical protein [Nitrospirillum amazonense]
MKIGLPISVSLLVVLYLFLFTGSSGAELINEGRYRSSDGRTLSVITSAGMWQDSAGKIRKLYNCGDEFQICFSDGRDFGFSFPRKCKDWLDRSNNERLRFRISLVAVLHEYLWIVFPERPNYIFQYADSRGVVGIYNRLDPPINFANALGKVGGNVSNFEKFAFYSVTNVGVAACE